MKANDDTLTAQRDQIDAIDTKLVQLITQRLDCVQAIAAYKKEHGLAVLDSNRERRVLERIAAMSPQELIEPMQTLFQIIMHIAKIREYSHMNSETSELAHITKAIQKTPTNCFQRLLM